MAERLGGPSRIDIRRESGGRPRIANRPDSSDRPSRTPAKLTWTQRLGPVLQVFPLWHFPFGKAGKRIPGFRLDLARQGVAERQLDGHVLGQQAVSRTALALGARASVRLTAGVLASRFLAWPEPLFDWLLGFWLLWGFGQPKFSATSPCKSCGAQTEVAFKFVQA